MNMRTRTLPVLTLGVLLTTAAAPGVRAEGSTAHCAESYENAQLQRANGKYLAAAEQARACSQLECSSAISRECVKLYEAIQQETPKFVFSAKSPEGQELSEVHVQVDGQPLLDRLDGKPVALDPGTHTFRFEMPGAPPVETNHTARVGDQNRLIEVVLGTPKEKPGEAPKQQGPRTIPVASYILAGGSVLALGTFGYLRVKGAADYNGLNQTCSPRCNPDDVDQIHMKYTLSYVALGVGAAALGGAAVFYFLQGNSEETPAAEVGITSAPGGARAQFTARF
jgi:hypothetical protein